MSFSFVIQASFDEDLSAAIDAAVDEQIASAETNGYVSNLVNAKALGMIELAKEHVSTTAGSIARPGDRLSVSVSGHANPSKDPEPGWADNALTVSVSQLAAKEA